MPEDEATQPEAEQPEEGKKKRRGRPPGSNSKKKEQEVPSTEKFYVIGAGENITDCEPKIVKSETLIEEIRSFSEHADIKASEVLIFELGPRVKVEQELKITPVSGG
jgi:hypothetical protein